MKEEPEGMVKQGTSRSDGCEYLSLEQAMERLHVSRATIDRWRRFRNLPFHKFGRTVRIRADELSAWMDRQRVEDLSSQDKKIVIGYQSKTAQLWSGVVIKELGLFERELADRGLRFGVSWKNVDNGLELLEEMIRGSIQIGSMGDYPFVLSQQLSAVLPRFKVQWLACDGKTAQSQGIAVMAAVDHVGTGLLRLATVPHSSAARRIREFLRQSGWTNVCVEHEDMDRSMDRVVRNSVAAACLWEPYPSLMRYRRVGNLVWSGAQVSAQSSEDYLTAVVTDSGWLTAHEDAVLAYLRAHLKAHQLLRQSQTQMAKVLSHHLHLPVVVVREVIGKIHWDAALYHRDLDTFKRMAEDDMGNSLLSSNSKNNWHPLSISLEHLSAASKWVGITGYNEPLVGEWDMDRAL